VLGGVYRAFGGMGRCFEGGVTRGELKQVRIKDRNGKDPRREETRRCLGLKKNKSQQKTKLGEKKNEKTRDVILGKCEE